MAAEFTEGLMSADSKDPVGLLQHLTLKKTCKISTIGILFFAIFFKTQNNMVL